MELHRNNLNGGYPRVPGKGLIPYVAYPNRSPVAPLPRATITISGVDFSAGCCATAPHLKVTGETLGTNRVYCLDSGEGTALGQWRSNYAPGVDQSTLTCGAGTTIANVATNLCFENGLWRLLRYTEITLGFPSIVMFYGEVADDGTYPIVIPNLVNLCVPYTNPSPNTGACSDWAVTNPAFTNRYPLGSGGQATVEFLACGSNVLGALTHPFVDTTVLPNRNCCEVFTATVSGGTAVDGVYSLTKYPQGWESPKTAGGRSATLFKSGATWRLVIGRNRNRFGSFSAAANLSTLFSQTAGPCPTVSGWSMVSNQNGGSPRLTLSVRNCWDGTVDGASGSVNGASAPVASGLFPITLNTP